MKTLESFLDEIEKLSSKKWVCKRCGYESEEKFSKCPKCGEPYIEGDYLPIPRGHKRAVDPRTSKKVPFGPEVTGEKEMVKRTQDE